MSSISRSRTSAHGTSSACATPGTPAAETAKDQGQDNYHSADDQQVEQAVDNQAEDDERNTSQDQP
jgi:hypothetical protein